MLPKEYVATLKLEYVFQLCVCLVLLVNKISGVPKRYSLSLKNIGKYV